MTEQEAKGFIQGKLDCMKKCGIFNKEDNVSDKDCDNCDYCYSQGNFGEQKNAFEMAIKALEEIQQYRAIGTIEECRENKEFLEFLYNRINPNDMEQYLSMYHGSGEKIN